MKNLLGTIAVVCIGLLSFGCGGESTDNPDTGAKKADAGAKTCTSTQTTCGSTCCDSGESCVSGACVTCACAAATHTEQCGEDACGNACGVCEAGKVCNDSTNMCAACGTTQTACGDSCCNNATQSCNGTACVDNTASCTSTQTACGATCCTTATQTCVNAACVDNTTCAADKTACGTACCNANQGCQNGVCINICAVGLEACNGACCTASQTCENNVCVNANTCESTETACGTACCTTATQYCSSAATSTCTALASCTGTQTVCGANCCEAGETCTAAKICQTTTTTCAVDSSFASVTVNEAADKDENGMYVMGALPTTDGTVDYLSLQLYDGYGVFSSGLAPGSYTLAGEDLDFATCGLCVLILADVDTSAQTVGAYYMATGGGVTITDVTGSLTATLTNVTFEHVTIDESSNASTPVGDGCNSTIVAGSVVGTLPVTCDPGLADSCGAGQGCYYDDTGAFSCGTAGGGAVGSDCSTNYDYDCLPGLGCWQNDAGSWVCTQQCSTQGGTSSCAATETCEPTSLDVGLCVTNECDLLTQDCATGACYPGSSGTTCETAGTVAVGATCAAVTDCVSGATCVSDGTAKACYQICNSTTSSPCDTATQTCYDMNGTWGVCVDG